ncbi:MAG: YjgN family protein [Bacteroidia bacterium]
MEIIQENAPQPAQRVYPLGFKGEGGAYFGIAIVNLILTFLTLGLYYPWAKAKQLQFLYGATEFEGSRFEFHGTGKEMFKGFIKAVIIFTIIYGVAFFAMINHWLIAGVIWLYAGFLILIPLAIHGSYKYRMSRTSWRGIRFGYRGKRGEFFGFFFKELFFTIISLGLYGAWFSMNIRKYVVGNIRFGDAEFKYAGRGSDYFLLNIKGYFLTILTLGIYSFWWQKDLFNYYINKLSLHQHDREIRFRSNATGGDFAGLLIINGLLMLFTLGIGYPWVVTRTLRFVFSKIEATGNIEADHLVQTEKAYTDATGEDVSDMLDLGFVI